MLAIQSFLIMLYKHSSAYELFILNRYCLSVHLKLRSIILEQRQGHQKDFKVLRVKNYCEGLWWIPTLMNIQEQSVHASRTFLQAQEIQYCGPE